MPESDLDRVRRIRAEIEQRNLPPPGTALPKATPTLRPDPTAGPGILGAMRKGWIAPPVPWGQDTIRPWEGVPDSQWPGSDAERASLRGGPTPTPPASWNPAPPQPPPVDPYDLIQDPQTLPEKVAYDVAYYSPGIVGGLFAAPALGAAVGVKPALAVAAEAAGTLGGLSASRIAEERGASPLTQAGVDIASSMLAAGTVSRTAPRVVGRLTSAPEGAIDASQEVVDYLAARGANDILPPGARPPDMGDAYEASIQLQRQLPVGVEEPGKFRGRLAPQRIEEVQRQFPDPNRQPSLSQALSGQGTDDLGGANVARRELQYAAADPDYSAATYGRRLETQEWVEQAYREEQPRFAGYAKTRDTAQTILEDAEREASRLWSELDLDVVPPVSREGTEELLSAVRALEADNAKAVYMPREAKTIAKTAAENGGRIPYSRLQSIASELSTTIRSGNAAGPVNNEMAWRRAGQARDLQPIVERLLDEADPGDVAALRAARAATRRAKELRTPVMEEIVRNADPVDVLQKIRRADDIAETTAQTRAILGEEGVAGLRAASWDEIFGASLGERTPKQMRSTLNARNNRQLYEALFEPEQLSIIEKTINRQARATAGRASTSAQPNMTGTGYQAGTLDALEALQGGRGSLTAQMLETVRRGYRKLGEATNQSLAIEKLASQDLELARLLLQTPTPDNLPALASVWRQALARAHRRAPGVFAAGEGAVAAGRHTDDGLIIEPHVDDISRIREMRQRLGK